MITLYEPAYAKLNLTLDVLGKRPDGYHDLCSVMQTVSLKDDIEIDVGTEKPWHLECDAAGIPADERNLAWKAAKLYCDRQKRDPRGLTIRIWKHTPFGAGMGGGSADAAAVLRALNRYYGEPLSILELADLGAEVGSDVPFCTLGGTVMCEGRGERLRELPAMPDCTILICKPLFSVATPELYRKLDDTEITNHPDNAAMEDALRNGDLCRVEQLIGNVFDPVVSAEHPEIEIIKAVCRRFGSVNPQMTGSGSVIFAIMPDKKSGEQACDVLRQNYAQVLLVKPV